MRQNLLGQLHLVPFFFLPQVVVPSLQSRLRNFCNAEVWHVVFNVFKDCSDRHIYHSSWIEVTVQPQRTSTTSRVRAAVKFLSLSGFTYCPTQTLFIPDYVHGQPVKSA